MVGLVSSMRVSPRILHCLPRQRSHCSNLSKGSILALHLSVAPLHNLATYTLYPSFEETIPATASILSERDYLVIRPTWWAGMCE